MAAPDIKSRLRDVSPEIAKIMESDFRKQLDTRVHILDLSYKSLIINTYNRKTNLSANEQKAYDTAHATLIEVVKTATAGKTFSSLQDPAFKEMFNRKKSVGVIFIHNATSAFLVGTSFESVQKFYSTYVAKDPRLKSTRFGTTTSYKPEIDAKKRIIPDSYTKSERVRVDIGHIPSDNDINLTSPLKEKFQSVLTNASSDLIRANAEKALKDLFNIQADLQYSFRNTTPETITAARDVLGEGYVMVTLHSQKLNNKFSVEENKIYNKLLRSIALNIDYTEIAGSNTIKQDLAEGIVNTLKFGKNKKLLKKHNVHSGIIPILKNSKVKVSKSTPTIVPESTREQTSLISLEALLRARINEQVKQNMGTGNDKKVLNYRTGRLAESVSIERLSESRAGMVSVFYNYMRNPYGTFSEGGRQQYPRTRDPKLLISKSIREIGAAIVGTRMRAVLV